MMSLRHQAIRASKWSSLAEITSKGISPLIFIILAKILAPEAFGIVAIAAMIINFSQIFWDAGLSKALIQREDDVADAANIVFWTNVVLGLIIYLAIYGTSGLLATLFHEPEVKLVIQVQGVIIILSSLTSAHIAILQKELNFKTLFIVRLFTTLPNLLSIPLALLGFGYWSLVYGSLSGAILQVIVLWVISPWKPKFRYNFQLASQLIKFGIWVTGEGLLAWLYMWADTFLIGLYLGTHALGIYRTGHMFVLFIYGLIFSPIMPVLFSTLSRLQFEQQRLSDILKRTLKSFSLISLPAGITIFILQDIIARSVFNENWLGIETVIGWLGIMYGLSWTIGSYSEAYKAIGRPDINTKIMFIGVLYYLPCYIVSAKYGILVFLVTRFFLTCITILIHQFFAKKYLSIDFTAAFNEISWIIMAAASMALILYAMTKSNIFQFDLYINLSFYITISLTLYLLFLFKEWHFIKHMIKIFFEKNYDGHDIGRLP